MKRLFFIISLLLCLPLAAQQTSRARVVDAETGEPLPCVRVLLSSGARTYTNLEGGFSLETKGDVIRLTKEGYETLDVKVADTGTRNIRMQPLAYVQANMTEEEVERMVYKRAFRMHKAYKKDKAANGADEEAATNEIVKLFNVKFYEDEFASAAPQRS